MSSRYLKIFLRILFVCIVYCMVIMTSILLKDEPQNKNANELSVLAIDNNYKSVVSVVVKINLKHKRPWMDSFESEKLDVGSGVILDKNGYIVTNYHVIENASEVFIKLYDGEIYEVDDKNIFTDPLTDIAVIKIDANNLFTANLGNSNRIEVGQEVIALGNPLGLFSISNQVTATKGIVSAKKIDFGFNEDYERTYKDMIQTDASINPGNSGGPLLNLSGELVGLNTFVIKGSNNQKNSVGLNFAIPINRVIEIYNELKEKGSIDREFSSGILVMMRNGVSVREINENYAKLHRLDLSEGVVVDDVEKKSSAEKADIRIGDIILRVNEEKVNSAKDITRIINEELLKTGDKIKVIVLRNNNQIELNLSLDKGGFE